MKKYQINRPINRPILRDPPWWLTDVQALPPAGWCEKCGAEVYTPNTPRCSRCSANN